MKQIAKSLVITGAMIAAGCANADVIADLNPYIGADYYQAWMKPKGDYNTLLPKDFPGATLYIGTKFHESFGIELGYDWSARKKKDFSIGAGTTMFGSTIAANQAFSGTTKIRRSGGHLDLVGFLPVAECFDLIGSVGFGWVQTKFTTTINTALTAATTQASAVSSMSGKGRGVLRVGVGASYMVTDMVGLRAKVSWESTSSVRVNGNQNFTALNFGQKPYKSTTALSVGAFVKF